MRSFVTLHKEAITVSTPVFECISSLYRHMGSEVELLTPEGWFERGHDVLGVRRNFDYL